MPKTQMTNQQWLDACWRLESAQVLMWALGLLSEMPTYDTQADLEELKAVPHERLGWFIKSTQLRHEDQVDPSSKPRRVVALAQPHASAD